MLRNLSIALRLYLIVLVMLVALGVVAWGGIGTLHNRLLAERQSQCRILVTSALGQLELYERQAKAGTITEDDAKDRAIAAIAAMSAGRGDYLWVNDLPPTVIWHPMTELVGRDAGEVTDAHGVALFREFVLRTRDGPGAFVTYDWPKPGAFAPRPKISYVERFAPWGWVVGSGIYVDDLDAVWTRAAWHLSLFSGAAGLLASVIVWLLGDSITHPLGLLTRSMRRLAQGEEVPVPETERGDEIGDLTRAMAVFRATLAEREEARRAHELVLREAKTVFDHISEAVMLTDVDTRIKLVNPSFTRITGYGADEVMGHKPSILASGRHDTDFYAAMYAVLNDCGQWRGEIWNRTKTGEVFPESLSIAVLTNPQGVVDGYIATFHDITSRKRQEARIRWRAEHDALTGLSNRAQFDAHLADAVRLARVDGGAVAVLYVDLDGFKPVNDRLGHAMGDKVLRRAAKRMRAVVRSNDVVARLGGDEFAIIIPGLTNMDDSCRIAAKLVDSLAEPFTIGEATVTVGASVGVAMFPDHAQDADSLVAAADAAMYQAKQRGKGKYAFCGGAFM
jgi:diguanylate cyclase (GGDEF)-like protein/PAS domain S-box-containing protein